MLSLATLAFAGLAAVTPATPSHVDAPSSTAAATAALASTYDQAACDPSDSGECGDEAELVLANQSLPLLAAIPAVLDCTASRVGALTQAMIGSCDMPRTDYSARPGAVRAAAGRATARVAAGADGARAQPATPSPPRIDDSPTLLAGAAPSLAAPASISFRLAAAAVAGRDLALRFERPPRT